MKRETGYYWVKYNTFWHMMEWKNFQWSSFGGFRVDKKKEHELEINETRILNPEECVEKSTKG